MTDRRDVPHLQGGRYQLDTVMPGHYGGAPAHIHIAVTDPAAGRLLTELHFASDHALRQGQDQINVVQLSPTFGGCLRATFDIVLAGG